MVECGGLGSRSFIFQGFEAPVLGALNGSGFGGLRF